VGPKGTRSFLLPVDGIEIFLVAIQNEESGAQGKFLSGV
jgi:hypothetical protein